MQISLSETKAGNKFNNKKVIYCQPIALVTPDKPKVDNGDSSAIIISKSSSANSESLPSTELNPSDDFTFEPLNLTKSKLLNKSDTDLEDEIENVDLSADACDKWLTMNENKRRRKQKRKLQGGSPQLTDFKKQDQKTTPTGKKISV